MSQIIHHLHKDGKYKETLYATDEEARRYRDSNGLTNGMHPSIESGTKEIAILVEEWITRLSALARNHERDNYSERWNYEVYPSDILGAARRVKNVRSRCFMMGLGYRAVKKLENPSITTYAIPFAVTVTLVEKFILRIEKEFTDCTPIKWFFKHDQVDFWDRYRNRKLQFTSSSFRPEATYYTANSEDDESDLWDNFQILRGAK